MREKINRNYPWGSLDIRITKHGFKINVLSMLKVFKETINEELGETRVIYEQVETINIEIVKENQV